MSSSQFTLGITMLVTGGTLVFLKKGLLFGSFLLVVGPSFASEKATKLKVNRHSRSDVVAFWHRYYQASEGYENRWDGAINLDNFSVTAPPAEFTKDVQRRVNFYRALVGLRADISFEEKEVFSEEGDPWMVPAGTTKSEAARAAALVFDIQKYGGSSERSGFELTHSLDPIWEGFTAAAWNAAFYSNLAGGLWGPGAIDGYMEEPGTPEDSFLNRYVGHRRWMLFTASAHMATGDIPTIIDEDGLLKSPGANVLYMIGDFSVREEKFVAWPNDGFCPAPIVPDLWSLSYPGADFSKATVTMTGPNGPVISKVVARSMGVPHNSQGGNAEGSAGGGDEKIYGDSTIIWVPSRLTDKGSKDATYELTVDNILSAGLTSYSYSVTIIDPNVLLDLELEGTEVPPVSGANYYFGPVRGADQVEFEISQRGEIIGVEGAELDAQIIDGTNIGYDLIGAHKWETDNGIFAEYFEGTRSFRLAFAAQNNVPEYFELDHQYATTDESKMKFQYRRGIMTNTTHMDVEFSTDGGVSWTKSKSRVSGVNQTTDDNFFLEVVQLPVSDSLSIRFFHSYEADGLTGFNFVGQGAQFPIGIFIDDIILEKTKIATGSLSVIVDAADQQVSFSKEGLGISLEEEEEYNLRVRPIIAGFAFAWSEVKRVEVKKGSTSLKNFDFWAEFVYPTIDDFDNDFDNDGLSNGVEYALGTSPIHADEGIASFSLIQEGDNLCLAVPAGSMAPGISYSAEWSTDMVNWSSAGVVINDKGGQLKALAPAGGLPNGYIRWVISSK